MALSSPAQTSYQYSTNMISGMTFYDPLVGTTTDTQNVSIEEYDRETEYYRDREYEGERFGDFIEQVNQAHKAAFDECPEPDLDISGGQMIFGGLSVGDTLAISLNGVSTSAEVTAWHVERGGVLTITAVAKPVVSPPMVAVNFSGFSSPHSGSKFTDPHPAQALYDKYPVGTIITSYDDGCYGDRGPDIYEVISHDDFQQATSESLTTPDYLAVKWVGGPSHLVGRNQYNGFYEHHIGDVVQVATPPPTLHTTPTMGLGWVDPQPWIPSDLADVFCIPSQSISASRDMSKKPQPKYGWR